MILLACLRSKGFLLLWVVVLLTVLTAVLVPAQEPPPESFRYRVEVQVVLVPTSVIGHDGRPVTDLEQGVFEVYENGQLRPLRLFERRTGLPLQLALLVDASLSAASELSRQKEAMARFIRRVLLPGDSAALYELSGKPKPVVDFTSDSGQLETGLQQIRVRAGTALYDAIVEVCSKLKEREGRRVIVIISDGNDTTSKADFQAAMRAAQEAEVMVFGLVVRPIPGETGRNVRGEHVMINFADLTGGRVFFTERTAELDRFLGELNDLLRTQYLLGYQPAPPGLHRELRSIEVRLRGREATLQHRKGYYAEPRP